MLQPGKSLPTLRVVGALWRRAGRVFLAQRRAGGDHGGLWEFPGGKQELGETARVAMAREGAEELGVTLTVGPEWASVSERLADVRLVMRIFQVHSEDEPQALDHEAVGWFDADALAELPMPPMDDALRQRLIDELRNPPGDLWHQTFCFVPGVSHRTESALWTSGAIDHDRFRQQFAEVARRDEVISREQVVRVQQALTDDERLDEPARWNQTKARHRWRLLERWRDRSTALDFECDRAGSPTVMGVATAPDDFTAFVDEEVARWWLAEAPRVVPGRWTASGADAGLLDGQPVRFGAFTAAPDALDRDHLILLFGGRKFDVAMLRKVYDHEPIPERFADLLDLARQAKHRGGLKAVERALCIPRAARVADLRGRDAITLYDRVTTGGEQAFWAFADLIAYNRADTVNLFALRDRLLLQMSDRLGLPDWYRRVRT